MKLTLINPPFLFPVSEEIVYSHCIGLRCLSALLKREGHEICFLDALMLGFGNVHPYANGFIVGLGIDDLVTRIPPDAELVGVSVPFSQLAPIAHDIVTAVKRELPRCRVGMGGVYPSTQPGLALSSEADFIVLGEGENPLRDVAAGMPLEELSGVYTRSRPVPEEFAPAEAPLDLDALPLPDYDIPHIQRYFSLSQRLSRLRAASLVTSRGCPFDCEFCSVHPVCGRRWRARSASHVLEEIALLVRDHGVRVLEVEDDNFTLRRDRAAEILEGIIRINETGRDLSWNTPNGIRLDSLDEELVRLIKRSNCQSLVLALEHGDDEMLNIMNKRLDLELARRVIGWCGKHEIPLVTMFVIVGYPGETRKRFRSSLRYLKSIRRLGDNLRVHVNIAQPYPETELLRRCRREGVIKDPHIDNFLVRRDVMSTGHSVTIETPDFDRAEVLRRKCEVERVFKPPRGRLTLLKKAIPEPVKRPLRGIRPVPS